MQVGRARRALGHRVGQRAKVLPDVAGPIPAVLAGHAAHTGLAGFAVLAPFIPSGLVALFSGAGIAALQVDAAAAKGLRGQKVALPAPAQWAERESTSIPLGTAKVGLTWLALGAERVWAGAGTSRGAPKR